MEQIEALAAKLKPLGLSDKEARVYVASLFLGHAPVQKIAEQAGVNRATTYVILDQLAGMGLVSQSTEGKKTIFIAEPPEQLDQWFEKREREVRKRREDLKAVFSELQAIRRDETPKAPAVRFYRGKDGVIHINSYLHRTARPRSTIYAMTNYDEALKIFPDALRTSPRARLKKKLASRLLYSYKAEVISDPALLRKAKKLRTPVKADLNFYEDRAALITYSPEHVNLTGILIESPEIVGALRQLFELAWEGAEKGRAGKT